MRRVTIFGTSIMLLAFGGCSSGPLGAPIGLDKRPANPVSAGADQSVPWKAAISALSFPAGGH